MGSSSDFVAHVFELVLLNVSKRWSVRALLSGGASAVEGFPILSTSASWDLGR